MIGIRITPQYIYRQRHTILCLNEVWCLLEFLWKKENWRINRRTRGGSSQTMLSCSVTAPYPWAKFCLLCVQLLCNNPPHLRITSMHPPRSVSFHCLLVLQFTMRYYKSVSNHAAIWSCWLGCCCCGGGGGGCCWSWKFKSMCGPRSGRLGGPPSMPP